MKTLIGACALLLLTICSFAQHVYQIRADTVRIYNTCDTAELVLENRTQDTLGFLFNKGKGRTEFRKLSLKQVGDRSIAIEGQDTLELGTIIKVAVDTLYRSNDTLFYWKTDGQIVAVNMGYKSYGDNTYVPKARTFTMAGGTGISITPAGAQDMSANRSWTVTNTAPDRTVTLSNGAGISVTGEYPSFTITNTAPGATPNLQQVTDMGATTANSLEINPNADAFRAMLIKRGTSVVSSAQLANNNNTSLSWTPNIAAPTTTYRVDVGTNLLNYYNNGTIETIWRSGNHPAGTAFSPTLTGANVLSSITTNSAGHVTALTTRTITAGDIGAAPAGGSTNYVQNQITSAQSGNFWLTGHTAALSYNSFVPNGNLHIGLFNNAYATANRRWGIFLSGTETGSNAGSIFSIARYDDAGTYISTPFSINRQNGNVVIPQLINALQSTDNNAGALSMLGGEVGANQGGQIALYGGTHSSIPGGIAFYSGTGTGLQPERMRISANGNVGIGVTAPVEKLQVQAGELYIKSGSNTNNTVHNGVKFGTDNDAGFSAIRAARGLNSTAIGLSFFTSNAATPSEIMRLTPAGYLGIGTTSPSNRLHLVETGTLTTSTLTTYAQRITQNGADLGIGGAATGSYIQSFNSLPLFINGVGNNVGIGTTSAPPSRLTVSTPTGADGIGIYSTAALSASSGPFIRMYNTGTPSGQQRLGGILWGANTSGTTLYTGAQIETYSESAWTAGSSHPSLLRFLTTPSGSAAVAERMRITAAGNVGIGTTTPSHTLEVAGTARVSSVADLGSTSLIRGSGTGAANVSYLRFTASDGSTRAGYVGDGGSSNSDMYLTSDAGGVRLVPLGGGSGSLNVQGTSMDYSGGQLLLNNGTSNLISMNTVGLSAPTFNTRSTGAKISLWNAAVSAGTAGWDIGMESSHIWFGIPQNTSTNGFKWYAGTTQIARLDGTGNLVLSGQVQATSFYQTSLRSLKKNIRPFGQSALQILAKAQVRTFVFKADSTNRTNIGFIADEVPDEMAAPQRSGVDQANTIALLVKAVQELTVQNKVLQQKVEAMEAQLKEKTKQ